MASPSRWREPVPHAAPGGVPPRGASGRFTLPLHPIPGGASGKGIAGAPDASRQRGGRFLNGALPGARANRRVRRRARRNSEVISQTAFFRCFTMFSTPYSRMTEQCPERLMAQSPPVRGEDGHGDAVERVADFGDVLGVSLFLGGEQVLLEARPVRQGMQGVGRPRDGGDVFVDFLFAFRREESLAEPRAIGGGAAGSDRCA